jgi:hypothetical protein
MFGCTHRGLEVLSKNSRWQKGSILKSAATIRQLLEVLLIWVTKMLKFAWLVFFVVLS